jgi:aminoacylase
MVQGGHEANVVPTQLSVTFDMRITPSWSLSDVKVMLDNLCVEAGSEVSYSFLIKDNAVRPTSIADGNIWWTGFKSVCDNLYAKHDLNINFIKYNGIS